MIPSLGAVFRRWVARSSTAARQTCRSPTVAGDASDPVAFDIRSDSTAAPAEVARA